MFWYYTQRPGICLAPVQLCGRDLSPVWFQSRTWNRFAFMVMSMSDHHCTSASGTHTWTLAKCARYSWIWCEILHSVYYNSKWILNSEIKMFIKNSNVVKCRETKRQFLYENIENSLCTQAILVLVKKMKVPLYRNKTLLCPLGKFLFTVSTHCLFPILNLVRGISLPFNYHNFHRVSVGLPANLVFPKILSTRIWSKYKNLHELAPRRKVN